MTRAITYPLLVLLVVSFACTDPRRRDADEEDDDDVADDDDATVDDDDDTAPDDDDTVPEEQTFTWLHTNVFQVNCACHSGASHSTGMAGFSDATDMYDITVGVPSAEASPMNRIEPGSSAESYLMHKLDGTHGTVGGSGSQMPLSGCCLSVGVRDDIRAWIDNGALP